MFQSAPPPDPQTDERAHLDLVEAIPDILVSPTHLVPFEPGLVQLDLSEVGSLLGLLQLLLGLSQSLLGSSHLLFGDAPLLLGQARLLGLPA